MEQYDFTDTGNAKDIYGLLDCMSDKELEMAREAVRNIRETAQLAQYERYKVWFDHTPVSYTHLLIAAVIIIHVVPP